MGQLRQDQGHIGVGVAEVAQPDGQSPFDQMQSLFTVSVSADNGPGKRCESLTEGRVVFSPERPPRQPASDAVAFRLQRIAGFLRATSPMYEVRGRWRDGRGQALLGA